MVFDGYQNVSTKDMTHLRRAKKMGTTVEFTSDMPITMVKAEFLSNKINKEKFVNLLGKELEKSHCEVYHADGDADLLIVLKAIESAKTQETVLIGDDTDLLILLCYHTTFDLHPLHLKSEPKSNSNKNRLWNIQAVKRQLGTEVCNNILFLHAILGCDTTSRLHGIGKGKSVKKFRECSYFHEQVILFDSTSVVEDVIAVGENILVSLYNGKPEDNLDSLRYKKFCEKVTSSSCHIQPQALPPTSAAAKYHSLRVHYQVQQWKKVYFQMNGDGN